MKFTRHFTKARIPVADQIKWKTLTAEISGTFKQENVEVPEGWSQNATNILAQKYFRKAGVPNKTKCLLPHDLNPETHPANLKQIPHWILPSEPTLSASPAEHQATPDKQVEIGGSAGWPLYDWLEGDKAGNLGPGWIQYRKTLPSEALAPLPKEYQK